MEDKRFPIPVRGFLISWNFINLMAHKLWVLQANWRDSIYFANGSKVKSLVDIMLFWIRSTLERIWVRLIINHIINHTIVVYLETDL